MPREHPDQIISGSPVSERQLYLWLQDYLGRAEDAARGLAHARKDARWLKISGLLAMARENTSRLMNRPQGLVIPGARFNGVHRG